MDRSGPALSPAEPARERRAHVRVRMPLRVAVEDPSGTVFLPAADLSEGGMRLRGPVELAPGTPVRLVLELPDEPALQRLVGRVARAWRGPGSGVAVALDGQGDTTGLRRAIERRLGWQRAS